MAHAYFVAGELEEGIGGALAFVEAEYGLSIQANPNVVTLRHGLLSVDDARRLQALAELAPTAGDTKVLIVSASRLFHEAQNAMLKLFEEPPAGTVLILVIPSEGMLLPTLRSRLIELPKVQIRNFIPGQVTYTNPIANEFIHAKPAEREKIISKLFDRTKSDKDDEKQAARLVAIQLLEGLMQVVHEKWVAEKAPAKRRALRGFLDDSLAFMPILHERSGPLKLIFEHIQLTFPL